MRLPCCLTAALALLATACEKPRHKPERPADVTTAAIGKLLVRPPASGPAAASGSQAEELFYQDQIRMIGSPDLRQRAEAAVLRTQPSLKIEPVTIQAVREKSGSVVTVIGRSANAEFARAIVDSLMEAYVASKQRTEDGAAAGASPESATAQKELREAERQWTSFRLDHEPARLAADRADADRLLRRFDVSRKWFQAELDAVTKLSIEDDIRRRQSLAPLPTEMPGEFATMARVAPTMGELGYLSALKGANEAAVRAATASATKDREVRIETLRRQVELINELHADTARKREQLAAWEARAAELQSHLASATEKLRQITSRERESSVNATGTESAGAASIVERAVPWVK